MVIWGCVHPLAAERDTCWLRITRRRWWLRELWKKTVHRAAVPSRTCWWDRIELWPTASYIPSHTAIAELLAVAGLFPNASGPSPHCFLNPYSSYAELLTTHLCTMKVADTSLIHTTLSCCTVLSPPAKPSWTVCVMCSSILNSSESNKVADTATPWTARERMNVSHTSTSFMSSWKYTHFTTTDTTFPHGFWDSALVCIPNHCILL